MLVLLYSTAFAAEISLDDALRRAVDGSEAVAAAEAGLRGAEADQRSAASGWLPQLSGGLSFRHTFASEYDDLFGSSSGASNPFSDLPFGAADTWNVDLGLKQGIYQGGSVLASVRLAKAARDVADQKLSTARASAILSAAEAYYDALLAQRLLEIAQRTAELAGTTRDNARLAAEVGRAPEYEVLRASVDAENQRVAVIDQARTARLAEGNLRRILHLPEGEALALSTPLGDEVPDGVGASAAQLAGVADAWAERAGVREAELTLAEAQQSVALTRSYGLPSLAATASYGLVQYPDTVIPDADWRTNATAGLSLTVPIFAGGYVRAELAGAKADAEAARQSLELTRALAALDTADAAEGLDAARARWEATAGTVEQAERAFQIATTRLEAGISTPLELADARLLLQQAQTNRARAARDLQVARIRAALLPALPLSASSAY